jgi:hypothetical protein
MHVANAKDRFIVVPLAEDKKWTPRADGPIHLNLCQSDSERKNRRQRKRRRFARAGIGNR